MYRERLRSICWRIRQWSRLPLTPQGRLEVAKVVLSSCLCYHQQFVPVPADVMQLISRKVIAFILGKGLIIAQDNRPLRGTPARAIACLPTAMGGVGQVDLQSHETALQAKVAAQLQHPKRAVWKQLMTASLEKAFPNLGAAVLTQAVKSAVRAAKSSGRLSVRHAAYVEAFMAVGLNRHIPHEQMSMQQLRLEPLVGNHSICSTTDGKCFSSSSTIAQALGQLTATTAQPAQLGRCGR